MGYTHNKGFSATESGYAVGAKGSEATVISSAGGIVRILAAVTGSTGTGTSLPATGVSTISSTIGGTLNYVLANPPAAGYEKAIVCTSGSTTNLCVVTTATTGCTFDGSNRTATFNAADDFLDLVALSTTRWFIKTNGGSVALS